MGFFLKWKCNGKNNRKGKKFLRKKRGITEKKKEKIKQNSGKKILKNGKFLKKWREKL